MSLLPNENVSHKNQSLLELIQLPHLEQNICKIRLTQNLYEEVEDFKEVKDLENILKIMKNIMMWTIQ